MNYHKVDKTFHAWWPLTGWTLTSIAGFSGVLARVLERSLAIRNASATNFSQRRPSTVPGGLSNGFYGLIGGISSGVSGIICAPYEGNIYVAKMPNLH